MEKEDQGQGTTMTNKYNNIEKNLNKGIIPPVEEALLVAISKFEKSWIEVEVRKIIVKGIGQNNEIGRLKKSIADREIFILLCIITTIVMMLVIFWR